MVLTRPSRGGGVPEVVRPKAGCAVRDRSRSRQDESAGHPVGQGGGRRSREYAAVGHPGQVPVCPPVRGPATVLRWSAPTVHPGAAPNPTNSHRRSLAEKDATVRGSPDGGRGAATSRRRTTPTSWVKVQSAST